LKSAEAVPTRHLDLGCGPVPRNPYARDELFGVDIAPSSDGRIRAANLAVQPIPFEDRFFDSVSAYDFLEHVPRVLGTADGQGTRFPFVELMNEVWRVLKPGGLFYAVTPVYPHPAVFQDPTHVNVLTTGTHEYFARPTRMAAMYGFHGDFSVRRVQLTRHHAGSVYAPPPANAWQRWRQAQRERRGACGHIIWELVAQHGG
jgi:SAM-dependent methyltransferase